MPTEFTVTLENRPGTLANLSKALGEADVNIRSLAGMVCEGTGIIKLITNDDAGARATLTAQGLPFQEREILTVTLSDRPGELARYARLLGKASINLDTIFVLDTHGGYTEIAIGVDKLAEATALPWPPD